MKNQPAARFNIQMVSMELARNELERIIELFADNRILDVTFRNGRRLLEIASCRYKWFTDISTKRNCNQCLQS